MRTANQKNNVEPAWGSDEDAVRVGEAQAKARRTDALRTLCDECMNIEYTHPQDVPTYCDHVAKGAS